MVLHLHAGDRRAGGERALQQAGREVANSDRAGEPVLLEPRHSAEHRVEVHVEARPVDHVEIRGIEAEPLQRGLAGGANGGGRRKVVVPDLGGDEERIPGQAGSGEGGADLGLVAVHLGGVDVAVAEGEGGFDRPPASAPLRGQVPRPSFGIRPLPPGRGRVGIGEGASVMFGQIGGSAADGERQECGLQREIEQPFRVEAARGLAGAGSPVVGDGVAAA